ncbi:MAG: NADP-dependent malic enzyme [Clostridia bacterium]|nr:NADP-dependent malic enzyme [Clostridia bacterium]
MNYGEIAVQKHKQWQGKIEIICRAELETKDDLSIAYTPGVAQPCLEIEKNPDLIYDLTRRGNLVAVVTDGTAVLGLGDIGPLASMPVMEGKCALFKAFGNVDAVPICVNSKSVDEIVQTVSLISGSFGGINLEDISAPRCFEIERKLKECCDIPVFHDDQHGTAIVVSAAMISAMKFVRKNLSDIKCVINGAGSAGIAIAKQLMSIGVENIIMCDKFGIICEGMDELNSAQAEIAKVTNQEHIKGTLADAMRGADAFVGVSAPNIVSEDMIKSMNADAVVFPMANPTPEIMPDKAKAAGARIVGTGRSDYPNQINNVLAFPGIFRGALDARASDINEQMKAAAAYAIADYVGDNLSEDYIMPSALDKNVAKAVAKAVYNAAIESGVSKLERGTSEC